MVLVVRWDEIKDSNLTLDGQAPVETFPTLQALAEAGECSFQSPVQVSLQASPVGGLVEITGQAEVSLGLTCARCLQEYSARLEAPVELTLVRELPRVEADDAEVELSAEEMGLVLCEEEEFDLHDVVAEHLLMAMPLRPLCQRNCKGLCPICGADLNRGSCDCQPQGGLNKFAALKDFKVQKKT